MISVVHFLTHSWKIDFKPYFYWVERLRNRKRRFEQNILISNNRQKYCFSQDKPSFEPIDSWPELHVDYEPQGKIVKKGDLELYYIGEG